MISVQSHISNWYLKKRLQQQYNIRLLQKLTTMTMMSLSSSSSSSSSATVSNDEYNHSNNVKSNFIACNVYISAGSNHDNSQFLLKKLLDRTQAICSDISSSTSNTSSVPVPASASALPPFPNEKQLYYSKLYPTFNKIRTYNIEHHVEQNKNNKVVVVHAYIDPIYDRSSFHIAGTPWCVAVVVTDLVSNTFQELKSVVPTTTTIPTDATTTKENTTKTATSTSTQHPTIGLVDHISIIPLITESCITECNDDANKNSAKHDDSPVLTTDTTTTTTTTTGQVAQLIGTQLNILYPSLHVLLYGTAHPTNMSLAWVRKNQSNFFQSGTSSTSNEPNNWNSSTSSTTTSTIIRNLGSCTIGSPLYFVENYNIRLYGYTITEARNLTKTIKQSFPFFVEGLTLPYHYSYDTTTTGSTSSTSNSNTDKCNNSDDGVNNKNKNNINNDVMADKNSTIDNRLCYEVACNLLQPNIVSIHHVQSVVDEWYNRQYQSAAEAPPLTPITTTPVILPTNQQSNNSIYYSAPIPTPTTQPIQSPRIPPYGYRVGTTANKCLDALVKCSNSDNDRRIYDSIVSQQMLCVETKN